MEYETPAWALELRAFTEFTIDKLEQRLLGRFVGVESHLEGLDTRLSSFESRVTRKIDAMDVRLESIEKDVNGLKQKRAR